MKGWLTALGLVVALFALPIGLVAYLVLADREDLIWMVGVGVFLCWVALTVFVLLCTRGSEKAEEKRRNAEFQRALQR